MNKEEIKQALTKSVPITQDEFNKLAPFTPEQFMIVNKLINKGILKGFKEKKAIQDFLHSLLQEIKNVREADFLPQDLINLMTTYGLIEKGGPANKKSSFLQSNYILREF